MNRTILVNVNLEGNYNHNLNEAFEQVRQAVDEQNAQGYKVVSVTPLTGSDSSFDYDNSENQSYGYGYGISFTTGIILIFEEVAEE
ncbi:MAG: hypothetical protein KDD03_09465 [Gelidibacter sp.]|uniref:Uncharacterized protein n=1 Tax=Winogradskyella litoriviva TaxID=1220182 RepID=A0ABX2EA85_9FLAO|nr:hypothetical protein [Winogradskyella litoriviva]MCB0447722.1 hypothetical protein [Gelidibacter sp.]NRD24906.1 hypothetical protein [Winogradskyella litoriviva]